MDICIFCVRHASCTEPWCVGNPGKGCTYGYAHEFPLERKPKQATPRKVDTSLCKKCGLHPKNPKYATADCTHG